MDRMKKTPTFKVKLRLNAVGLVNSLKLTAEGLSQEPGITYMIVV